MEALGPCPICNGTGRKTPDESTRAYGVKFGWYGYKAEDDCIDCSNCGAQYMFGRPTGKVRLRRDNNEPCVHEYEGRNLGRCYNGYTCKHCGDYHTIDSGD